VNLISTLSNYHKNCQTTLASTNATVRRKGPVATSTKQLAGYFTVSGIENELSIPEHDWPCFALKELLDNAYDWLNDYYPNSSSIESRTRRRCIAILPAVVIVMVKSAMMIIIFSGKSQ
jgi:hypothetical protein